MLNQGMNMRPGLSAKDFSFGKWDGYAYKMKNRQPVVLLIHKNPVPYPYMILSRDGELHFKTYREAVNYFRTM
ncbi:hypothetical protein [Streptococcus fryi]